MKKIDIHCHTTNRKLENVIPKLATPQAIYQEMQKYDISQTVLLATYFPHKSSGISNFRLFHWIRNFQRNTQDFLMFGSMDFENYFYQGMNELEELAQSRLIKGIKLYTCYQNIDLESERFENVVKLAKRRHLPLMFHTGMSYTSLRKYGKPAIANMVKASDLEKYFDRYGGVNFILSHMSKPFFFDLYGMVDKYSNVYSDMSGLVDSKFDVDEKPEVVDSIKMFLENCGPKKLLFGTDFPVQTHEDSVYFIEEAMRDFSEGDKQDVYYNNAWGILYGK